MLEPVLLIGATITGCLVLHEFAIRRVRFLRPLFGLKVTLRDHGEAGGSELPQRASFQAVSLSRTLTAPRR